MRNYSGFAGFRNTDERFTAYTHEQEYLLVEGLKVYVLDVEPNVEFINTRAGLGRWNGAKVTVVYLQVF